MLSLGFKESPVDKCLLYRPGMMICIYVDDGGVAAPSKKAIENFMHELKELNFDLKIEDDFSTYLGISID